MKDTTDAACDNSKLSAMFDCLNSTGKRTAINYVKHLTLESRYIDEKKKKSMPVWVDEEKEEEKKKEVAPVMLKASEVAEDMYKKIGKAMLSVSDIMKYTGLDRKRVNRVLIGGGADPLGENHSKRYFYRDVAKAICSPSAHMQRKPYYDDPPDGKPKRRRCG